MFPHYKRLPPILTAPPGGAQSPQISALHSNNPLYHPPPIPLSPFMLVGGQPGGGLQEALLQLRCQGRSEGREALGELGGGGNMRGH